MTFKKLIAGYKSFHKDYFTSSNRLYEELVRDGQKPETLVIACSDSRADPAILTHSGPGEMFVVRNVAAIVPPYQTDSRHHGTSAAIEYAVKSLKVKHIIVMGHSLCGGIAALANKELIRGKYEFISQWIEIGAPALEAVERELVDAPEDTRQRFLEQAVILVSLNNLLSFPWIKAGVEKGELEVHGWYFDLGSGLLYRYNGEALVFEEIASPYQDDAKKALKGI